jgi:hypothetical protein
MIDHDLDIADRGKRVAIHGHRPGKPVPARFWPLRIRVSNASELGRIAMDHPHPAGRQRYAELGEPGQK